MWSYQSKGGGGRKGNRMREGGMEIIRIGKERDLGDRRRDKKRLMGEMKKQLTYLLLQSEKPPCFASFCSFVPPKSPQNDPHERG